MKETNVIRTHAYGKTPHDVYTIAYNNGNDSLEITEPSLLILAEKLGSSYIPQEEIEETIGNMESAGKTTFSTEGKLLFAKEMVDRAINAYDVSDKVNIFKIVGSNGESISYWLPAAKRNQLVTSVTTWSESHDNYTLDLREYGTSLSIPCNTLLQMLSKLEDYAVQCYNATSRHLNAVKNAQTIEEVTGYDYTAGYPDSLVFSI